MIKSVPGRVVFFWGLVWIACHASVSKNLDQLPALDIPMISEEALISRLSDFYVSHPTTDEASQKNVLINLAIDNRWDLQRSSSGILYHLFDTGSAEKAKWGDKVRVHYRGFSLDKKLFDSSLNRGEPFEFYVGNVIPGWNEALTMLGENGYGIFIIPAYLAYGQEGFQKKVQPNEHLIFQIKLLELLKD